MKTFFWWKNSKFPTFKRYTVSQKMLYHQWYSADFQKLSIRWKMWKIGICAKEFHGPSYFSFAMVRMKTFFWWKNSKFPTFKLYTVSEKMLYHQRYSPDFQKLSFCWKTWKIGIWRQKFHGRSYFSFSMVRMKTFFWWKNSKFPTFKLYSVSEKMLYHQRYSADFQKLSIRWKMWKIGIRGKEFHGPSYFSFAMVRMKTFFWWKNSKFPTFKLYTVSEKMLYHQRYSADFQKLSFCWKMWKIGIWPKISWAQLF